MHFILCSHAKVGIIDVQRASAPYSLLHAKSVRNQQDYMQTRTLSAFAGTQVLGRNLEALVTRAQEVKADWRDEFVSVEHMLLAFVDDTKFGTELLKGANLDKAKLEEAVKEIRGSNRVTDQVSSAYFNASCLCQKAAYCFGPA